MRSSSTTTDGWWRGLPGVGFAEAHLLAAVDHAAASGALSGSVLIGYDGRAGARELAHLAADLLTTHGLSCVLTTGAAPTPAIGRLVWQHSHLNAAIIVTASHNPPGFLGVKLRDGQGQGIPWPAPSDDQRAPIATLPAAPQPHPSLDVLPAYATTIGQTLTATAHRFDGHLVIDAAHGALGALATHLPELHEGRPDQVGQVPMSVGDLLPVRVELEQIAPRTD
jgi:phosphomannomutase